MKAILWLTRLCVQTTSSRHHASLFRLVNGVIVLRATHVRNEIKLMLLFLGGRERDRLQWLTGRGDATPACVVTH